MSLQGKGFFISDPSACEGGDPAAIVAAAQAAELSHVLLKIGERGQASGADAALRPLVQGLHGAGIAAWGWHAVTGEDRKAEAALAIRRVRELSLDGYVLRVGSAYERPGRVAVARAFLLELRAALREIPLALIASRFPYFHPALPWTAFLENCDAVMPQVYWEAAHDAALQLKESVRQYRALPNARPCLPIGATYATPDGWAPSRADLDGFLAAAKELGVEAASFFSWETCRSQLPHLWELVAAFDWPHAPAAAAAKLPAAHPPSWSSPAGPADSAWDYPAAGGGQPPAPASRAEAIKERVFSHPTMPDAFTTQYLNALKSGSAAKVSAMYAADAIHVRADKVLNGLSVIRAGYSAFFFGLPAGVTFELLGVEGRGDVRYIAWKAGTLTAYESIILRDGVVVLEYTYIE